MCLYSQGIFQKEDNSLKVQWRLGMCVYCVLCEARTLGMRCRADRNNGATGIMERRLLEDIYRLEVKLIQVDNNVYVP